MTLTAAMEEVGRIMTEREPETIEELSCPEQFVLWTARSWVAAFKARQPIFPHLRDGFAAAGTPDGLFALDELMALLASAARRSLDIRCVKCRHLGEDEVLLLRCLAACQAERAAEIDGVLTDWLPPAAARMAVRPAMVLAAQLDGAGLRLPRRSPSNGAGGPLVICPDPGLRRLQ